MLFKLAFRNILRNRRRSIMSVGAIAVILALTIIFAVLTAPFLRPFSLGRLFFTLVVPIVPLFLTTDGFVSCLRTYSVPELKALINRLDNAAALEWHIGTRAILLPFLKLTYVVGVPRTPQPAATTVAA